MIPIIIVLAIVALVALIILHRRFRETLADRAAQLANNARELWYEHAPTWGDVWDFVRPILWILLIFFLLILLFWTFLSLIFFAGLMTLGITTGHTILGIIVGILFPTWLFLKIQPGIFKKIPYIGRTVVYTGKGLLIILTLTISYWSIMVAFPNLAPSLLWKGRAEEKQAAINFDEGTAKLESVAGNEAMVTENDTKMYSDKLDGKVIKILQKGDIILTPNVKKNRKDADERSEGRIYAITLDEYGDYEKGKKGWVSALKLDWEWKREATPVKEAGYIPPAMAPNYYSAPAVQFSAPAAETPRPEKDYSGRYKICWVKEEGMPLDQCIRPRLTATDGKLTTNYSFGDGNARMKFFGNENESGVYKGDFTYSGVEGNFTRGFEINLRELEGYIINSAGQPSELRIEKLS